MPSSPRSFSINSLTSLPRSPTSAITLRSAFTFRAIIPISVDLPTPEPAKIPILCPLPIVRSPSIAFTPSSIGSCIFGLVSGFTGMPAIGTVSVYSIGSPSSSGFPSASIILPISLSPTLTFSLSPVLSTILPGPMPSRSVYGISSTLCSLNPTTSAGICDFISFV